MNEEKKIKSPHNLMLKDRKSLNLTGVSDVDSFDEKIVVLYTDYGKLTIKGENLHIDNLNLNSGELAIDGKIFSITYTGNKPKPKSLFSKVFK